MIKRVYLRMGFSSESRNSEVGPFRRPPAVALPPLLGTPILSAAAEPSPACACAATSCAAANLKINKILVIWSSKVFWSFSPKKSQLNVRLKSFPFLKNVQNVNVYFVGLRLIQFWRSKFSSWVFILDFFAVKTEILNFSVCLAVIKASSSTTGIGYWLWFLFGRSFSSFRKFKLLQY